VVVRETMNRTWAILLLLAFPSVVARGDGVFIGGEKVPVGVPYQRAVIIYGGGKETLIVQSKYELQPGQTAPTLAWVVPVPSVPEMASVDAVSAERAFRSLGFGTGPITVHVGRRIAVWAALVLGVAAVGLIALAGFFPRHTWAARHEKVISACSVAYIVMFLFWMVLMPAGGLAGGTAGVEVVKAETVGIYDAKVIRGEDHGAVMAWLKGNGFSCNQEQEKAFQEYVNKGWCFVTAKVRAHVDPNSEKIVSNGLASPLILRFDTEGAVYPIALTATAGGQVEVVLYVLAYHKMGCAQRIPTSFAGQARRYSEFVMLLADKIEPADFFLKMDELGYNPRMTKDQFGELLHMQSASEDSALYMTKFKGKMAPAQMREDIVFRQAADDEHFRERDIKWW